MNSKAQYAPLVEELKDAAAVLDSGRFIFGPEVEAFEHEAAAFLGVPHAIGVANGTGGSSSRSRHLAWSAATR